MSRQLSATTRPTTPHHGRPELTATQVADPVGTAGAVGDVGRS